jgi:hypothetical protein
MNANSLDGSVNIVKRLRLEDRKKKWLDTRKERQQIFLFAKARDRLWGPLASYSKGTGALSQSVKQPGLKADHLPP